MPIGPQVSVTQESSPDIPKSEWYKDGDSWYKTVLEIEWQSGIIVPCETVNRHLAGSERGRLSLCLKTAGLLTAAAVSRIESAQSKLTTKRTGLCD